MLKNLRLAFLLPALLLATPVAAGEHHHHRTAAKQPAAAIRYVTLDKMIRTFAAEARQDQAKAAQPQQQTIVATR